ncbi:hypothetical protein KIPB_000157, partial [Kipferlia bialata]|eukprot:g157.t1
MLSTSQGLIICPLPPFQPWVTFVSPNRMSMRILVSVCLVSLCLGASVCDDIPSNAFFRGDACEPRTEVGVPVAKPDMWGTDWVFRNLLLHLETTAWYKYSTSEGDTDTYGRQNVYVDYHPDETECAADAYTHYPTAMAEGYLYGGPVAVSNTLPYSEYVCTFSGTGSLDFRGPVELVSESDGVYHIRLDVIPVPIGDHVFTSYSYRETPYSHALILISHSDVSDPVHSLKCVPESDGLPSDALYTPEYIAAVQPFDTIHPEWESDSTLSEDEWNSGDKTRAWEDRPMERLYYKSDESMPYLYYKGLAEETGLSISLTLPADATDGYVTQCAEQFRDWSVRPRYLQYGEKAYMGAVGAHLTQTVSAAQLWDLAYPSSASPSSVSEWVMVTLYDNHLDLYLQDMKDRDDAFLALANTYVKHITYTGSLGSYGTGSYDSSDSETLALLDSLDDPALLLYAVDRGIISDDPYFTGLAQVALDYGLRTMPTLGGIHLRPSTYGARFRYSRSDDPSADELLDAQRESRLEGRMTRILMGESDTESSNQLVTDLTLDWLNTLRSQGSRAVIAPALTKHTNMCEEDMWYNKDCGLIDAQHHSMETLSSSARYQAYSHFAANGGVPLSESESAPLVFTTAPTCPSVSDTLCVYGVVDMDTGLCLCHAGYSGDACDTLMDRGDWDTRPPSMGVSMSGVSDWQRESVTRDLMTRSRQWLYGALGHTDYNWNTLDGYDEDGLDADGNPNDREITLSDDGYPLYTHVNRCAHTLLTRDIECHSVPDGRYVVLYSGQGVLDFNFDAAPVEARPGRIVIELTCSTDYNNGLHISINRTDPEDPIRDIVVVSEHDECLYVSQPMSTQWLDYLRRYRVLRFMDLMVTNHDVETDPLQGVDGVDAATPYDSDGVPLDWETRLARDTFYTWTEGGIPVEQIVTICNTLGSDPWVNIGHKWSDGYVTQFATYLRDNLRPDVSMYIELSNEVWGTGYFPGAIYAASEGSRVDGTPLIDDEAIETVHGWMLSDDMQQMGLCWYAMRSLEVWSIFESVFGSRDRLVRVAAGQAVTVWPWRKAKHDALLDEMAQATGHTPRLISYESAVSFTMADDTDEDVAQTLHRDSRMGDVLLSYTSLLQDHLDLVVQFGTSGFPWALNTASDTHSVSSKEAAIETYFSDSGYIPPTPTCADSDVTHGQCLTDGTVACDYGYTVTVTEGVTSCELRNIVYDYCSYSCEECVQSRPSTDEPYLVHEVCTCGTDYEGDTCYYPVCEGRCGYHGTCTDPGVCECYEGYSGDTCEIDCGCNGHGVCSADNSSCVCDTGYVYDASLHECVWDCEGEAECSGPGLAGCSASCVYGDCIDGACVCWAGYGGDRCLAGGEWAPNMGDRRLGMNVSGISDWSTESVFSDLFMTARQFVSDLFMTARQWVTQEDNKWVLSPTYEWDTEDERVTYHPTMGHPTYIPEGVVVSTLMLRDTHMAFEDGQYTILYDGDGTLTVGMDASLLSYRAGVVTIQYSASEDDDNGLFLTITRTNPDDPLRNIRVVMAGYEDRYHILPWHPAYLEYMGQFGAIRVMNWLAYIDEAQSTWATRHTTDWRDERYGMSLELIVDLINRTGADLWLTLPYASDDTYIRGAATMLRDGLRPDVKVYLEGVGNENWNGSTAAGEWAEAEGVRLGLVDTVVQEDGSYTTDPTCYYGTDMCARQRYTAVRCSEVWSIFSDLWGDSASRLVNLVPGWLMRYTTDMLAYQGPSMSASLGELADMLATGGYWDCGGLSTEITRLLNLDIDSAMAECQSTGWQDEYLSDIDAFYTLALSYDMALATYEGGPAFVEQAMIEGQTYRTLGALELFEAMTQDDRLEAVYYGILEANHDHGISLQMHFTSTGMCSVYGCWGLVEYTGQDASLSPKYRAVSSYLNSVHIPSPTASDTTSTVVTTVTLDGDTLYSGTDTSTTGILLDGATHTLSWETDSADGAFGTYDVYVNSSRVATVSGVREVDISPASLSVFTPMTDGVSVALTVRVVASGLYQSVSVQYVRPTLRMTLPTGSASIHTGDTLTATVNGYSATPPALMHRVAGAEGEGEAVPCEWVLVDQDESDTLLATLSSMSYRCIWVYGGLAPLAGAESVLYLEGAADSAYLSLPVSVPLESLAPISIDSVSVQMCGVVPLTLHDIDTATSGNTLCLAARHSLSGYTEGQTVAVDPTDTTLSLAYVRCETAGEVLLGAFGHASPSASTDSLLSEVSVPYGGALRYVSAPSSVYVEEGTLQVAWWESRPSAIPFTEWEVAGAALYPIILTETGDASSFVDTLHPVSLSIPEGGSYHGHATLSLDPSATPAEGEYRLCVVFDGDDDIATQGVCASTSVSLLSGTAPTSTPLLDTSTGTCLVGGSEISLPDGCVSVSIYKDGTLSTHSLSLSFNVPVTAGDMCVVFYLEDGTQQWETACVSDPPVYVYSPPVGSMLPVAETVTVMYAVSALDTDYIDLALVSGTGADTVVLESCLPCTGVYEWDTAGVVYYSGVYSLAVREAEGECGAVDTQTQAKDVDTTATSSSYAVSGSVTFTDTPLSLPSLSLSLPVSVAEDTPFDLEYVWSPNTLDATALSADSDTTLSVYARKSGDISYMELVSTCSVYSDTEREAEACPVSLPLGVDTLHVTASNAGLAWLTGVAVSSISVTEAPTVPVPPGTGGDTPSIPLLLVAGAAILGVLVCIGGVYLYCRQKRAQTPIEKHHDAPIEAVPGSALTPYPGSKGESGHMRGMAEEAVDAYYAELQRAHPP